MSDIVVAAGVEKMTDVGTEVTTDVLAAAADREWEGIAGITFPGLYAMIATDYMHRYGLTREQLAQVAVKTTTMVQKSQRPVQKSHYPRYRHQFNSCCRSAQAF